MEIGLHLSAEEHPPERLVDLAGRAERAGFSFLTISDHYLPWTHAQGQSAFVWTVLGALAERTETIEVGTAVTCPTTRIHPAIVAQAAATCAVMMPGRFFLGVGTGEALNEHILGDRWPASGVRREMLEEAVEVMRLLWQGGSQSHYGRYYTVEQATIFTLPEQPPPVVVSGFGPRSAELAGRIGDGYMNTSPSRELAECFRESGGDGKRCYGKLDVCVAVDEATARRIAKETWPTSALKGEIMQTLPLPAHFEQAVAEVTEDQVAASIVCDQRPEAHLEKLRAYADAGYDRVAVQQVGVEADRFFEMYERELLPEVVRDEAFSSRPERADEEAEREVTEGSRPDSGGLPRSTSMHSSA